MPNEMIESPESQTRLTLPTSFEMITEFAHRYPRDIAVSRQNVKRELETVPGLAARAYYSIPYNQGRRNETRVEGISIWGAECLRRHYKNTVAMSRFDREDDDYSYLDGLFFDAENNNLTTTQVKAWKFYKPRDSNKVLLLDPTMRRNAEHAAQSKAKRNAIIHGLPEFYKEDLFAYAKELIIRPKAGERVKSIQERISDGKKILIQKFKIDPDFLESYIDNNWEEIENENNLLVHLTTLFNGLKDKEFSVIDGKFESRKSPSMPQEK